MHTTQKTFDAEVKYSTTKGILLVSASGGGSVIAEYDMGGTWVTMATFNTDCAYEIDRRVAWRITPSGGASYDVR